MKPVTRAAQTIDATLEEVVARLARNEIVDGVMMLGSTGTEVFTVTSDYDLLIVLTELSAPVRIVNTWIDHRFAEIYCTTIAALDRIVMAPSGWDEGTEEAVVLGWLHAGRIAFDRNGRLGAAIDRAHGLAVATSSTTGTRHEAWRKIGYNVAQIRRYLSADDAGSRMAVNLRLLYSVDEVRLHYFTIRRIPWRGEKPAIRYWQENDPAFLDLLGTYFDESDLHRRVDHYVSVARHCLAPLGSLWEIGETAISLGAGYGTGLSGPVRGTGQEAHDFWDDLVG